jgi:hypothetical protein
MTKALKQLIWSQFGASIDMLRSAINACPEELWSQRNSSPGFWYLAYHTLFWLDFYLTESPDEFEQYPEIGLTELDPEGIFPQRTFTRKELLDFLEHGRSKCKKTIYELTDEKADRFYKFGSINFSFLELILYNMRHVQHHCAQLNLILRQEINSAPGWIKQAEAFNIN